MKNLSKLHRIKEALRSKYAWPGGYPIYLITSDGAALSIDAARENWGLIVKAYLTNDRTGGWYVEDAQINWESFGLYCDHSGQQIEAAYSND